MGDSKRPSGSHITLMGPPETPTRVQASPQYIPTLQLSPDLFNTPSSGFATVLAYPHQPLFWDSGLTADEPHATPAHYQNPFTTSQAASSRINDPSSIDAFAFQSPQSTINAPCYGSSSRDRLGVPPATTYAADTGLPAPFHTSPRVPPPRGEDPGLFLSSPARRFGGSEQPSNGHKRHSMTDRPAYYHQIEEARREKEIERARKVKARRSSGIEQIGSGIRRTASPAVNSRPGVRRSLTHSGVHDRKPRPLSSGQVVFAELPLLASDGTVKVGTGGRSSPLKSSLDLKSRARSSGRPPSRNRASLTFAIDEDGRARTVVTTASDSRDDLMELDDQSSASEASSLEESDFHVIRSQHNSFVFSDDDDFSPPTRLFGGQVPNHSKHDSYSTIASSNSARQSSWTGSSHSSSKPGSSRAENIYVRPAQPVHNPRLGVPGRMSLDTMDEEETVIHDSGHKGDAQQALRAIMNDRSRTTSSKDVSRGRSLASHFHSSPPIQHQNYSAYNESPTTITDPDLSTTPSTDRDSLISNGSTRCVCSSSSPDGQFMIQCESCSKWLHTTCVGIDNRHIPEVFVCVFCARTPMRHGRIRAGLASPLAHKSSRFR